MRTLLTSLSFVLLVLGLGGCGGPDREVDVLASSAGQGAAPVVHALTPDEQEALRFAIEDTVALSIEAGTVRSGQSLSHLLSPAGVSAQMLHAMATDEREAFDVRRMKAGNGWSLFSGPDGTPRHFAYTISSKEYVVFDLTDQGRARRGQFPSETRRGYVEGEVRGSLYQVLEDEGHSTTLALAMSQVMPGPSTSAASRPATDSASSTTGIGWTGRPWACRVSWPPSSCTAAGTSPPML